jgi:hypothetical protein
MGGQHELHGKMANPNHLWRPGVHNHSIFCWCGTGGAHSFSSFDFHHAKAAVSQRVKISMGAEVWNVYPPLQGGIQYAHSLFRFNLFSVYVQGYILHDIFSPKHRLFSFALIKKSLIIYKWGLPSATTPT